ncbi:YvrJ family protein [Clostridium grantii]|uniref:YvrJ protein family protein n=1 Tax=Clostridium grantii DSM 8605 TaxID=1121316 RepID=A0A1M5XME4_9CLOT|nr:YvrJ family protein [Clostridium grantii]SHI01025.1 YvrJ protein family protein [Clostridium grantii DSM 8605]
MYDEFTNLISSVGFPIGICVYLLVRFEKKIELLNKSIQDLTAVITVVMGNQKR